MLASIELERAGYNHVVIEKNEEVGGCWWKNCYSGVSVDTASHFYFYSFEISPEWNHFHPHGGDMREYFRSVADKYGVHHNIRFNTRVLSREFDEANAV